MNLNNKGFTLIELVVVIAIIGILGGAVFMSIKPGELLENSRDTTRKSDVRNLSNALSTALAKQDIQLVSVNNGSLSRDNTSLSGNTKVDGTGYVAFNLLNPSAVSKIDLNKLPLDPSNGNPISCNGESCPSGDASLHKIVYCSDGVDFEVNVALENDTNNEMSDDGGDNARAYEVGTKLTLCPSNTF
jgi:prepilin-type N-terminal cleavage/methylation domain-containing protein